MLSSAEVLRVAPVRPATGVRIARAMAASLWVVAVSAALIELSMIAVTLDRPSDQWGIRGYEAVLGVAFGSVGALIARRRPDNVIGWLGLFAGVVTSIQGVLVQVPVLVAASATPLPGAELARWITAWSWVLPAGAFIGIFPLVFPDGHLLSPRWRPALYLGIVAIAAQIAIIIAVARPFGPIAPTNNPAVYFEQGGPIVAVGYGLLWLSGVLSTSSLIVRYRRARGDEQAQIKWVAYAVVLVVFGAALGFSPFLLGQFAFIATAMFAAAAIAIAILRYRLYQIDTIINRTLVYGALTAILAGVYTASITLSTRLFSSVTGERSDAAIVLTTLIVVSMVTPMKTRLQSIVDRRMKAPASQRIGSSLEALEALEVLIRINASGGLTAREFRAKKTELLRRV